MDEDKKVWVPHPVDGYTIGRIIDIGGDTVTVEPFNAPGQVCRRIHVLLTAFLI